MPEINSDKVAEILATHFKDLKSIDDVVRVLCEDESIPDQDKLFAMFAMGRKYENGRLYRGMQELFLFGGKITDPDPDDEPDEKV